MFFSYITTRRVGSLFRGERFSYFPDNRRERSPVLLDVYYTSTVPVECSPMSIF